MPPPTSFKMDLLGADKAIATLKEWVVKAPLVVAQAMRTSALHLLVPAIRQRLRDNLSVFRGQLFQRVAVRTGIKKGWAGKEPYIEVGSFGVPYGLNVEKGSPPHEPDVSKIREYVRIKKGIPGDAGIPLVNAIVATIKAKGTKPHPFLMPAWEATRTFLVQDALSRVRKKLEQKGAGTT